MVEPMNVQDRRDDVVSVACPGPRILQDVC
jgi:hypothetical protein